MVNAAEDFNYVMGRAARGMSLWSLAVGTVEKSFPGLECGVAVFDGASLTNV